MRSSSRGGPRPCGHRVQYHHAPRVTGACHWTGRSGVGRGAVGPSATGVARGRARGARGRTAGDGRSSAAAGAGDTSRGAGRHRCSSAMERASAQVSAGNGRAMGGSSGREWRASQKNLLCGMTCGNARSRDINPGTGLTHTKVAGHSSTHQPERQREGGQDAKHKRPAGAGEVGRWVTESPVGRTGPRA